MFEDDDAIEALPSHLDNASQPFCSDGEMTLLPLAALGEEEKLFSEEENPLS